MWSSNLGFSSDSMTVCIVLTPTGGMLMGLDNDPAVCRALLAPYHRLLHNNSRLPRGLTTSSMPPTLVGRRTNTSSDKEHETLVQTIRPLSATTMPTIYPLEPAWSALLFRATANATAMQDQATQLASELKACGKGLDMSQWRVQRCRDDQRFAVQRLQEVFQEKEQCLLDLEEAGRECVESTKRGRLEVVWWLMVLGKNGRVNGKGKGGEKGRAQGVENLTKIEGKMRGRKGGREEVWGRDGHVGWLSEDV